MREEMLKKATVIGEMQINDPFVEFGYKHGDQMQDLLVEALDDLQTSLGIDDENWEVTKGFFTVETMEQILKSWAEVELAELEKDYSEVPQCGGYVK